jgi:hypothetical protein
MPKPPIDTFELETAEGFRRLEFDLDLLRSRDVRVLLDGETVATMPFPTTEAPRHEVSLRVGKHELLAITEARNGGALTIYDVFFEDRSLKNGSSLAASRAAAPVPSRRRPLGHRINESIIQIAPAVAGPSMGVAVGRTAAELGLETSVLLIAAGIAAIALGSFLARRVWSGVLAREDWSTTIQASVGALAVVGTYVATLAVWIAFARMMAIRAGVGVPDQF